MLHVSLPMPANPSWQLNRLSAALLLAALVELALSDVSLTVEVVEIERQSYAKQLV